MQRLLPFLIVIFVAFTSSAQGPHGLDLDGTNDYIQSNYNGISGSSARTVECWVKTTANCNPNAGGLQNTLVDWGTFVTAGRFTLNILWNNAIRIETGGAGLNGSTPINDGMWHHVAAVYDPAGGNNKFRLYLDGELETQGNISVGINTGTSTKVRIGRRIDGVNHFDGTIDEVRIWSVAKTSSQIAALMDHEICWDAAGLQFYYAFNQGTAGGNNVGEGVVYDQANSYNGTLYGFSYVGSTSNWVDGAPVTGSVFAESDVTSCTAYPLSDGSFMTASGSFTEELIGQSGCDSVVTVNFEYAPILGDTLTVSSCSDYETAGGQILTSSGTYSDLLQTAEGCDSLVTYQYTQTSTIASELALTVCSEYTDNAGNTYTSSGVVTETYLSGGGCDSLVYIDLTIIQPTYVGVVANLCPGETYTTNDGVVYDAPGEYVTTLIGSNGCDSVVTLQLNGVNLDVLTTFQNEEWSASSSNADASFAWWNCNGDTLIGNGPILPTTEAGWYYVEASASGCSLESDCVEVASTIGVSEATNGKGVNVYPVPSQSELTVEWSQAARDVELIDARGTIVAKWDVAIGQRSLKANVSGCTGWCLMRVHFLDGSSAQRVVIQR